MLNLIIDGLCTDIKGEIPNNTTLHLQSQKLNSTFIFQIRKLIRNPFIIKISKQIQEMKHDSNCRNFYETGNKLKISGGIK